MKAANQNFKFSLQRKWCGLVYKLYYIYPYILKSTNSFYMGFCYHKNNTIFEVKCYNPSIALHDILALGANSIIFTSGTLFSINYLENELNYKFEISYLIFTF